MVYFRRVHFTPHAELQLLALLIAVGFVLVLAARMHLPVAIPLVCGGLLLGFVPGLPEVQLPPDLVLVAILPPLLYSSAFFTGLRDLRANLRPISLLAVGLVAVTTAGVAWVGHDAVHLSWASAFTLGAIVSPTDALAATEVARRVGAPRRVVSIIEGESLVNDGLALVLYKTAVAAAVAGTFSLWSASWHLLAEHRRRHRRRARRRLRRQAGAPPRRRHADGGRDRAPVRLSRLPARCGARRLGGARRRDDRRLHGLVHPAAHDGADAPFRQRVLGDPRVPRQRAALRARRSAAPVDRRPAERQCPA